jgi:hypothetical protein
MSVNLNQLPIEAGDVPQVDFDNYQDPTEFPPPVPAGTYSFKTTKIEIEKFEAPVVSFIADHELFDPATGNKVGSINFDRFTTKVFQRQNVPASMAADMLRAAGITTRPNSPREWGEAILSIKAWCDQGNTWVGAVDWEGYCSHKDTEKETLVDQFKKPLAAAQQIPPHRLPYSTKGMKSWPQVAGVNGAAPTHEAVKPCPTCGNDVPARAKIVRRIPR